MSIIKFDFSIPKKFEDEINNIKESDPGIFVSYDDWKSLNPNNINGNHTKNMPHYIAQIV